MQIDATLTNISQAGYVIQLGEDDLHLDQLLEKILAEGCKCPHCGGAIDVHVQPCSAVPPITLGRVKFERGLYWRCKVEDCVWHAGDEKYWSDWWAFQLPDGISYPIAHDTKQPC
jgi:hypothetical protein